MCLFFCLFLFFSFVSLALSKTSFNGDFLGKIELFSRFWCFWCVVASLWVSFSTFFSLTHWERLKWAVPDPHTKSCTRPIRNTMSNLYGRRKSARAGRLGIFVRTRKIEFTYELSAAGPQSQWKDSGTIQRSTQISASKSESLLPFDAYTLRRQKSGHYFASKIRSFFVK